MTEEGVIRTLNWSIDSESIQSITDDAIANAKKALDEIATTPEGDESISTLQEFEEILAHVREVISPLTFLKYVSTNAAQRDAAHNAEQDILKFINEVWSMKAVYEVLARIEGLEESMGPEERSLLTKTLRDFRHSGAALDDDVRMEFLEIANNISVRESDFNKVLNEITTKVKCTKKELEGVPPEVYESLEMEDESYLCTLDYPIYVPIRQYAKNPETRRRMLIAFEQRGGRENSERLSDTLALRDRQAKLLNHPTFAAYEISRKMAKKPDRVIEFLAELREKLTPIGRKEMDVLKELKARELGQNPEDVTLELHDLWYYHEMLMREKYAVDQNEVKKYFPMDLVVKGVLDVYQKVLNLEFRQIVDANVWHEDVTAYEVFDTITGSKMGMFYLDLYPRVGKFKHYAVSNILERREKNGIVLLPITSMLANFQKPTPKQPSLLTHPEVITFFHEFGHLMHVVTNKTRYARFGLDGVLPDFIEVPSQMLENWAWKEEVLTYVSGHYEDTAKKLPSELLKKMLEAKLLNEAIFQLRQIFFGTLDMSYHTNAPEDTTTEYHRLFKEILGFSMPKETVPEASFGHLMGGYQAGYYSYLWSKVYAEDLFTKFEEAGFMDEKTGLEYREKILAPGGSRDPDEMVRDFLGRESNNEAFMRALGITKE
ncbi:MAG: M3 family metallopeptidase [Candidatus Thorarchaeota archaeon]